MALKLSSTNALSYSTGYLNLSVTITGILTICYCMFVYGGSVLGLRFGLLILSFYPMESFVLRMKDNPLMVLTRNLG